MRKLSLTLLVLGVLVTMAPIASSFHFHTTCTRANGSTGEAPTADGAQVVVGLDYYATPVVVIPAGASVTFTWDATNPYCHSVTGAGWGTQSVTGTPNGRLVPGGAAPSLFNLLPNPTNPSGGPLSYAHVFTAPGTYQYSCQEHVLIGMVGVVVVV